MINLARILSLVMFMTYLFTLPIGFAQNISTQDTTKTVTVIVDGLGKDIPDAAQNAAQNALTNVAGSFMDANTILEKRATIQDGIRNESKQIQTDIKEYSQGTIKHFEIVDSSIQNGLTRVTAKVSVRLEDFRAYIRKLAEGEARVEDGLFVKMQSINKQNKNKTGLLLDNILKPLTSGMVVEFNVESPKLLSEIPYKENIYRGYGTRDTSSLDGMIQRFGANSIISFRVTASLTDDFQKNMLNTIFINIIRQKKHLLNARIFRQLS